MSQTNRNLTLDLIRITAAFMVLSCHFGQYMGNSIQQFTAVGARGVQCFFLLSGYLAFYSLAKNDNVRNYWFKRAVHIIPMYYTVLVAQWAFDVFYAHFFERQPWSIIFSWSGIGGVRNLRYFTFTNLFFPSSSWYMWNNKYATWTMSVLFVYYLIVPFIYKIIKRFWQSFGIFVILAILRDKIAAQLLFVLTDFPVDSHIDYFSTMNPLNEMYCFFLGITVYLAIKEGKEFILFWGGTLVLLYSGFSWYPYEVIFSFLLMEGVKSPFTCSKTKITQAIIFLADGSFSLYLWHPLILKAWSIFYSFLPIPYSISILLCLFVILIFSYGYFYIVQKPVEKYLLYKYNKKHG